VLNSRPSSKQDGPSAPVDEPTRSLGWRLLGRPWQRLLAVAAGLAVVVGACAMVPQGSGGQATLISSQGSTGWIRIGDARELRFETTTCSADVDRFVAVGVGMDGDEKFVVRVRATDVVEVRYGTHDEMQPTAKVHRLTSRPADIWADGRVIRGTALLLDSAQPQLDPVEAELQIYCA
jgi:hypothetical protein